MVNIVIDQLRSDYLDAFTPLYGQGGFLRLKEKGRFYTPFSESIIDSVLADGKVSIAERWTEGDSLGREGFHWEAVILKKVDQSNLSVTKSRKSLSTSDI